MVELQCRVQKNKSYGTFKATRNNCCENCEVEAMFESEQLL